MQLGHHLLPYLYSTVPVGAQCRGGRAGISYPNPAAAAVRGESATPGRSCLSFVDQFSLLAALGEPRPRVGGGRRRRRATCRTSAALHGITRSCLLTNPSRAVCIRRDWCASDLSLAVRGVHPLGSIKDRLRFSVEASERNLNPTRCIGLSQQQLLYSLRDRLLVSALPSSTRSDILDDHTTPSCALHFALPADAIREQPTASTSKALIELLWSIQPDPDCTSPSLSTSTPFALSLSLPLSLKEIKKQSEYSPHHCRPRLR